jgi:hypothetical protein
MTGFKEKYQKIGPVSNTIILSGADLRARLNVFVASY